MLLFKVKTLYTVNQTRIVGRRIKFHSFDINFKRKTFSNIYFKFVPITPFPFGGSSNIDRKMKYSMLGGKIHVHRLGTCLKVLAKL